MDADGIAVPIASDLLTFSVDGDAVIAGTDNGDPTDHRSLSAPERRLFNGKALAVVRSGDTRGKVIVKAESETLQSATLELTVK